MIPEIAIANLLGHPGMEWKQIAEIAGVSRSTVARVARKLALSKPENSDLGKYQRLLIKRVPLEKRVGTIEKALEKVDSNPFVALRALEYADGVNGLAPKQQRAEQDSANQAGPSLVFPAGTVLDIGIRARTPDES